MGKRHFAQRRGLISDQPEIEAQAKRQQKNIGEIEADEISIQPGPRRDPNRRKETTFWCDQTAFLPFRNLTWQTVLWFSLLQFPVKLTFVAVSR